MNEHIERIDQYLRSIDLPQDESDQHRRALRRQILSEIERKETMSVRNRTWKVTIAVAALIGGGALATAVGVKVYRYHFEGRDAGGTYYFSTEPQTIYERTSQDANGVQHAVIVTAGRLVSMDAADAKADVDQMQRDLEEIAGLREQDLRELTRVVDMQVNGHFLRTCVFQYTLADGRTHTIGEADPDSPVDVAQTPGLIEADFEEIAHLGEQGLRDVVKVIDTEVEGQIQRTLLCHYVLADGREKTIGEGDPALTPPTKRLTPEQINEVWRLKRLGQGEFLEEVEKSMYGKTFTFESCLFTLADGTVVTLAEGSPAAAKTTLSEADWKELRGLQKADAGEDLGTYEEEIRGKVFTFARERYLLGDGTEVIHAEGIPRSD
jgi:hypothetical protein